MFEKESPSSNDKPDVFRPAKGTSKVIIGNGVKLSKTTQLIKNFISSEIVSNR